MAWLVIKFGQDGDRADRAVTGACSVSCLLPGQSRRALRRCCAGGSTVCVLR